MNHPFRASRSRSLGASDTSAMNGRAKQALTAKDRATILAKTVGRCHLCGGTVFERWTADHVLAHAGGGPHAVDNYLPAHGLCNGYKWAVPARGETGSIRDLRT